MVDLNLTLQDIGGEDWGEPTYPSHLVTECHRLRRVPLRDFRVEDLRILISQKFNIDILMPLALARLEENPWVDGDYYEGDLLQAVVDVPSSFWEANPTLWNRFGFVACRAAEAVSNGSFVPLSWTDELLVSKVSQICADYGDDHEA